MMNSLRLSVLIPCHNGGETLRKCLTAVMASTRPPDEVIVIDDASTDASVMMARSMGADVLYHQSAPIGPAKARNRGAVAAQGDVLVFIDCDVVVHQDTLFLIEQVMLDHREIAALFGSYDNAPAHRGFVSLYKNLQHHFVHQYSKREASTFWTGLGAIRRDVFLKLGGFNETFTRPSIEDIEFGGRLRRSGYRIWLCNEIQATHCKRWDLFSLLRSDIFDRAVPWTRLILSTSHMPSDLNLDISNRASAMIVWLFILLVLIGFWFPQAWIGAGAFLGVFITLNRSLYHFFSRVGGLRFTIGAIGLHMLYFIYSSVTFTALSFWYLLSNIFRPAHAQVPVTGDRSTEETFHD